MAPALKKQSEARSQRFDLRASRQEEALILKGAAQRGVSVSRFVIESACDAAETELASQRHFELTPAQFAQFTVALDRPARIVPAVQELFAEKSVIERDREKAAALRRRTA